MIAFEILKSDQFYHNFKSIVFSNSKYFGEPELNYEPPVIPL